MPFPARSKRQKAKGNIATGTEPNEGIGTVLVAEVAACFCSTALSSTWGKRKAIHRKTINWLIRLLKQKEGRRCSKCPSLVRNYFESVSAASCLNAHSLPDISCLHCHLLRLLTRSSFSLPHIGHTNAVRENIIASYCISHTVFMCTVDFNDWLKIKPRHERQRSWSIHSGKTLSQSKWCHLDVI